MTALWCRLGLHKWDHSLFEWSLELAKDRTCMRCGRVVAKTGKGLR